VRLLLITNDYPPKQGGIQQYLGNLVDHLSGPVRVLAPADGAAGTKSGEAVVARHGRSFMWPTPEVGRWIESEAARFEPDVVLFGAPHPLLWLTDRLRRSLRVPIGVLCHGAEITLPAVVPGVRSSLTRALRAADARFAVSRFTQQRVRDLTGRPVVYVGGGVDPETFAPVDPETFTPVDPETFTPVDPETFTSAPSTSPPAAPPVVGCVSRFVPRKGQHRLIEAAARLGDRGLPVQVLLVGSGRKEQSLRSQAARSGVEVRFEVGVPWATLPDLYRAMDVFAMPCHSRWAGLEIEGLGLVYLEAAAAGLPVLAGDSGGSPETVVPGATGFVVHSVDDLVEGIGLLIGDPARARAMGEAGRSRVVAEYTWAAVAARLEDGFKGAAQVADTP
jgi:phosphatidylinositol alpha-1,6-mannosyltransferase